MNTINKILILVIIIFLINHLTDGKIIETIKTYFIIYKKKVEEFFGLTYANKKDFLENEPYQAKLDKLNSLAMPKNEPASFESKDSKTSMLLNNLSKTQIVNEPGEKVKTFSSARFSEKSKDFLENEPYQAKLDKLNSSSTMMNEPGEKVKTFSSARFSEKSKDFLENEPYGYINSPTKYQKEIETPMKKTHVQQKAIQKTHELATKMTDSFNNYFVGREDNDNLFIKPTDSYITEGFMNDTDNSLIPSIIELSSYEQMSNTETSN